MSEILLRLARLARSHLYDVLEQRWRGGYREPPRDDPDHADRFSAPPFEAYASSALPYSEELAGYYRALDLPFGAPMDQVTKRWKTYLKKCHPDRYANNPEKQSDATRLTQELTRAHEKIKGAWEQHQA
jgi:hypothetical protein